MAAVQRAGSSNKDKSCFKPSRTDFSINNTPRSYMKLMLGTRLWSVGLLAYMVILFTYVLMQKGDSGLHINKFYSEDPSQHHNPDQILAEDIDFGQAAFVTGADRSHFRETRDSIASVQYNTPVGHDVLFFDLGLLPHQVEEVKKWCRVRLVTFDFSKYPPHVRNLYFYSFKPLVIREALQLYPAVVWFDSSCRFICPDFINRTAKHIRKTGIALGLLTFHSTLAVTNPGMYKYMMPKDKSLLERTQLAATLYSITNATAVQRNVFDKVINCSLTEDCIAPPGNKRPCDFDNDSHGKYANCHRYDQCALNLALLTHYESDYTEVYNDIECTRLQRDATSNFQLQLCDE